MEDQWLHLVLSKIEKDLDDIKEEIKRLNEFRFRLVGSAVFASCVITAGINFLSLWMKMHV